MKNPLIKVLREYLNYLESLESENSSTDTTKNSSNESTSRETNASNTECARAGALAPIMPGNDSSEDEKAQTEQKLKLSEPRYPLGDTCLYDRPNGKLSKYLMDVPGRVVGRTGDSLYLIDFGKGLKYELLDSEIKSTGTDLAVDVEYLVGDAVQYLQQVPDKLREKLKGLEGKVLYLTYDQPIPNNPQYEVEFFVGGRMQKFIMLQSELGDFLIHDFKVGDTVMLKLKRPMLPELSCVRGDVRGVTKDSCRVHFIVEGASRFYTVEKANLEVIAGDTIKEATEDDIWPDMDIAPDPKFTVGMTVFEEHTTNEEAFKTDENKVNWNVFRLPMIEPAVRVMSHALEKYPIDNWMGLTPDRLLAAFFRHMASHQSTTDNARLDDRLFEGKMSPLTAMVANHLDGARSDIAEKVQAMFEDRQENWKAEETFFDEESGYLHLDHALCCLMMYRWLFVNNTQESDA